MPAYAWLSGTKGTRIRSDMTVSMSCRIFVVNTKRDIKIFR